MLNYDLTPAKWASGNSTMRFSVETDLKNDPREIFEISTSMTWQPLRPLRRLRKLNRHRRLTVKKSRETHFLGQFSTGNRLVLVPEAHFDGVGS